jgi:uncharacterized protein YpuA (DUF1002 family)
VLFGADLDAGDRPEVLHLLGLPPSTPGQTAERDESQSLLAGVGAATGPDDQLISSLALRCPGPDGIQVDTHYLDDVTFASALLIAGVPSARVSVAAPAAQPVSGDSAVVGLLQASGECATAPDHADRVRLAAAYVREVRRLAESGTADQSAAALSQVVQRIATTRISDRGALLAAVDQALASQTLTLDPVLHAQLVDELEPLLGRDFGPYTAGYEILSGPGVAQLRPTAPTS